MATIKSYTDISQSKKLAEILTLESADMWYSYYGNPKYNLVIAYKGEQWFLCPIKLAYKDIPCWSLAALLNILKDKITFGGNSPEGWFCCSTTKNPTKLLTIYRDSLIDACYEIIIKLHELKML